MKLATAPLSTAGAALLFLLGPLAALATRAMPVWLLTFTAVAIIALWSQGVKPHAALSGYIRRPGSIPVAAWGAVGLIVWAMISVTWSPSPRALPTAVEIAYVLVGAWAITGWWEILTADHRRRWLRWFAVGLLVGMIVFVEEALFGYPLYQLWSGPRAVEMIIAGNVTKRAAAVLALLTWPLALLAGRRWGYWAASATVLAAFVVCLQSTSRTAVFGLAAGMLVAMVAAAGLAGALRRLLVAACVTAFVVAVPAGAWLARATADFPTDGYFRSALHRMEIWGHAAERIERRPVLGHGIDASRVLPKENETSRFEPLLQTVMPLHPHNLYLQVWLELGAVGAAMGALLMAGLAFATRHLRGLDAALALGMLGGGIAMASEAYGIWQAWWMSGMAAAGLMMWFQLAAERKPRA